MAERVAISRSVAHDATWSPINVGPVGDAVEREADAVADAVARGDVAGGVARDDGNAVRRMADSPHDLGTIVEADEEESVRPSRSASASASAVASLPALEGGRPLDSDVRGEMETAFGRDFSAVRVHADPQAAEAARSIDARAYTRGRDIAFAAGEYAPRTPRGRWLLAHELTHVAQKGRAPARATSPAIDGRDHSTTVRRVKWDTARDTGKDSRPWKRQGTPTGDVYEVQTDAGTTIDAWRPHDGTTYWCHGLTFGGKGSRSGPLSIFGKDVDTILSDDGWKPTASCVAEPRDILVYRDKRVVHSGIVTSVTASKGQVDEDKSQIDSKWGGGARIRTSWTLTSNQYGKYDAFSKSPLVGTCGQGANERR